MSAVSKKIGIFVLTLTLLGLCVLGGLLKSNRFGKPTAAEPSQTETETVMQALPEGEKADIPPVIRGTKLFLSEDVVSEALLQQVTDTGLNCVVFVPSESEDAFSASADTSSLSKAISLARSRGVYTAVRVRTADSADAVAAFAAKAGADSLILCGKLYDDASLQALKDALVPTCVSSVLADVPFTDAEPTLSALADGIYTEPSTPTQSDIKAFESTLQSIKKAADGRLLWVGQSEKLITKQEGVECLAEVFSQLSAIFRTDGEQPVSTVFCAFSDFGTNSEYKRIIRTCFTEHILPDNFLKDFKITNYKKTAISTNESKITFNGECNPLYPLTCNNKAVTVTQDGFFAAEFDLTVGKNTFTFSHRGKSYTYDVNYVMDLIKIISPSGTLSTPGGNVLEISVVAHRKASKVYATVNGTTVNLVGSNALLGDENSDVMDTSSDYVTYSGKYNLPESTSKNFSLGAIKAYATYQGISDSINGAVITITAAQKIEALPVVEETKKPESTSTTTATSTTATTTTTDPVSESEASESEKAPSSSATITASTTTTTTKPSATTSETTAQKLDPVITPYKYNGIAGKKRMCVVKKYYAETMPLSPLNDLSVPLATPLLTGTFDFITGESSFDTYKYYNLGSGRRVYRKDVEVIENAYAMPANTIALVSSGTASGKTDINLHLKWKVPFNVILNGQNYINDPQNKREYAVTSLNAKSLDITFYYTAEATGLPNVASSGVISRSEWIHSTAAQTYTLRLYLRNAAKFYGYSVSYNADDTLRLSIKEHNSASLSGKTIMLDPGHGGSDPGAPCAVNSSISNEAKINLAIAQKVREKLVSKGANVLMTRTSDSGNPTLEDRKKMARQNNPDAFVSIHCDSASSSTAYGTSAFYYRPYSFSLAKSIHTQLVNTYTSNIYGTPKSTIDRKTTFFPYSVCRIEECPSVLIECGYVSSLEECRILQTPKHQDYLASAIAAGIENYFGG